MVHPTVSVIIPTYNRCSQLREAVASVFSQTVLDRTTEARTLLKRPVATGARGAAAPVAGESLSCELIIVDDGSTDATETFCTALAGSTCRSTGAPMQPYNQPAAIAGAAVRGSKSSGIPIRYLRLIHTGMPGLVRNRGAHIARGRYLAFLDSDDLWRPHKLERQFSHLQQEQQKKSVHPLRISHTREQWLRYLPDGSCREVSQKKQRHKREGMIFEDALKKCIIGPSTVLMEASLFREAGGFREDLEIAEDYELWLRITSRYSVAYLDEALTVKRAGHPGQLSEKYGSIEYFRIKALEPLVDSRWFDPSGGVDEGAPANRFDRAGEAGVAGDSELTGDRYGKSEGQPEGGGTPATEGWFDPASLQRKATEELIRKCRIYAAGCCKRGREGEAASWEECAHRYENLLP